MAELANVSLKEFTRVDLKDTRDYIVSLIDKVCERYDVEDWTFRDASNLGMTFVEIAARVGDLLNFYIDKQAKETYLTSVVQRKNAKRILSLVNYRIRGPEPARTTILFTIPTAMNYDIVIPRYFQLAYKDGSEVVPYATVEECSILAGETEVQVDAVQGLVHTANLVPANLSRWRTTTITDDDVANDSVIITMDGEEWTQVPDVLYEEDDSKKYSVYENLDDQTVIEFGYSWRNDLPGNPNAPITIQYLTTLGEIGGVSNGRVNTVVDSLVLNKTDMSPNLHVTNLYDATGGADRETLEEARVKAPHITKSRDLMTTLKDYEYFAEDIPGVYKARAVDWNIEDGRYVAQPYRIDLYVVPDDRFTYIPNLAQRNHIYDRLKPHLWSAIELNVFPPEVNSIDLIVKVTTAIPESRYGTLRHEIENLYIDFFNKFNRSFSERFTVGQLENVVKVLDDVNSVEMLAPSETIQLNAVEFPKLNKIDVEIYGL